MALGNTQVTVLGARDNGDGKYEKSCFWEDNGSELLQYYFWCE